MSSVGTLSANILIVDDHPANLLSLEAVLEVLGHRLVKASSGEEALKRLLAEDFAVILMDVQMNGLDGFETASLIKQREQSRHIPIIFLTAINRDTSYVYKGYSFGAVDYMLKPFAPEILRSKVSVFVELFLRGEKIKQQAALLKEHELQRLERQGELRFRGLMDSMPQCVWELNPEGRIRYCNRRWLEFSGLTPFDRENRSHWQTVHPEDRDLLRRTWREALRTRKGFEVEVRLRRCLDGGYRWHIGRGVPECDHEGAVVGWVATATDIDHQKGVEAEQVLARRKIERLAIDLGHAISARDEFLSIASHELRTPLTSLQLLAQTLTRNASKEPGQGFSPEQMAAKFRTLDQLVRRQVKLVEDLLDVSRIQAGELQLELEEIDLSALTSEVASRFQDELKASGSAFSLVAHEPVVGRWDRMRLDQVITNLLSNAVKYGSGKPIEVRLALRDGVACLSVRDHGIGIATEAQERLFQRFSRAVSEQNYGGFGLGLWISRQIVEAMNGTIRCESQEGVGSVFTVELPRRGG